MQCFISFLHQKRKRLIWRSFAKRRTESRGFPAYRVFEDGSLLFVWVTFVSFLAKDLQRVKTFVLSSFPTYHPGTMGTGSRNADIRNQGNAVTIETECPCTFLFPNNFKKGLEIFQRTEVSKFS